MSKGFFNPLDPKIKPAVRRLAKALKSRSFSQLETTIEILERRIGETLLSEIIAQLHYSSPIAGITDEDVTFYWDWTVLKLKSAGVWEEAETKAVNVIVQDFLKHGLTFGKDFSFGADGEMLLSEAATQTMLEHVPEDRREAFEMKFIQSMDQNFDLKTIARNVGVHPDYFDRVLVNAKARLAEPIQKDDGFFVALYLESFLAGTETKFPELEDRLFGVHFLKAVGMGENPAFDRILDYPEKYSPPEDQTKRYQPLEALWLDIIQAAYIDDSDPAVEFTPDGVFISKAALKALSRVWEDDFNEIPLREVIASL